MAGDTLVLIGDVIKIFRELAWPQRPQTHRLDFSNSRNQTGSHNPLVASARAR